MAKTTNPFAPVNGYSFSSSVAYDSLQNEERRWMVHSHEHALSAETNIIDNVLSAETRLHQNINESRESINKNIDETEVALMTKVTNLKIEIVKDIDEVKEDTTAIKEETTGLKSTLQEILKKIAEKF